MCKFFGSPCTRGFSFKVLNVGCVTTDLCEKFQCSAVTTSQHFQSFNLSTRAAPCRTSLHYYQY